MRTAKMKGSQIGRVIWRAYGCVVLVLFQLCALGDPLDVWISRKPVLQTSPISGVSFNGILFADAVFVAVGNDGSIRISQDGDYWASVDSGSRNRLNSVAHGNNIFVVVGEGGTILRSPNGYSWETQTTSNKNDLRDVAFSNGIFVAVGDGNTILISSDAMSWTLSKPNVSASFYGITTGDGLFCAVGGQSIAAPSTILTSPDGVSWQSQSSVSTNFLRGICFANGVFVAVGNNGTILTSPDAEHWTKRTSGTVQNVLKVAYGNGSFVALRSPAGAASPIMTSSDGITWREQSVSTFNFLNAVTYAAGQFFAVGDFGTLVTSSDGNFWVNRSLYMSLTVAIAFGNGIYVAVGYNYCCSVTNGLNIFTSTNAINWTHANHIDGGNFNLLAVAYGDGQFVAVGGNGTICNSRDGLNWKIQAPFLFGRGSNFQDITYSQGIFIAVAAAGEIFTSPDGVNWASQQSGTSHNLAAIAGGNGVLVTGNNLGEFLTSKDSFTWTSRKLPGLLTGKDYSFTKIIFGNGLFCALISSEDLYVSPDALNWTKVFSATNEIFRCMAYGAGNFVVVGDAIDVNTGRKNGVSILTSQDGTKWVHRTTRLENVSGGSFVLGATFGDGSFVAVGGLMVIQSGMFSGNASLKNPKFSKGEFSFDVNGVVGQVYQLQMATNLSPGDWSNYKTITNWISPIRFLDTNAIKPQRRFYRAVAQ
jgi:hypothetical protein